MNYEEAVEFLSKGRNKDDRPLPGRQTRLQRRDDSAIAVKYSNTDVVTFLNNGDIVLESDGWRTVTTKERMNRYINSGYPTAWNLWQEQGTWYIKSRVSGETYAYDDGMVLHPDGTVTGARNRDDVKEEQKLRKRIRVYAKAYIKALRDGKVPAPSGGDCWYCALRPAKVEDVDLGGGIKGKSASGFYNGGDTPMGEAFGSCKTYLNDLRLWKAHAALDSLTGKKRKVPFSREAGPKPHLISHMDEKYYVPSLLQRAMEVMPTSQMMWWTLGAFWYPEQGDSQWLRDGKMGSFVWEQLEKTLKRYMYRQFGLAA